MIFLFFIVNKAFTGRLTPLKYNLNDTIINSKIFAYKNTGIRS